MTSRRRERITDDPDAGYGRPARRTRPRTKDRPSYHDAVDGRVITVDRGRYRCLLESTGVQVSATKARNLGRTGVIVGDLLGKLNNFLICPMKG